MSAKIIPCDTGPFRYRGRSGSGEFTPGRSPIIHRGRASRSAAGDGGGDGGGGDDKNRTVGWRVKGGVYSALLLVGLASPGGRTYRVEDVIEVVEGVRVAQTGDPSSSFMVQKGIYKHKAGGSVVHEDSVRVIILHVTDETVDAFKDHILALGERLVADLRQEEVIIEFQNKGVTDEVVGVTA